jgi:signal peptidase
MIILILAVYVFLNLYIPGGLMAYIIPITCWIFVTLTALKIQSLEKIRLWFNKSVTLIAILIAALQIVSLIFISFFTAFGQSPYVFTLTVILINIAYFSSALLGLELSRAYLIKSCPKRKVFTGIALTALFYAFISFSPIKFLTLGASVETAKFLGSDLLPALAQSLFATYLALLGGSVASIAYLGTLEAFEWLSPILPNPPWALKALITTLIPTIGFLTVNETVSPFKLMQLGIISRAEIRSKIRRTKKSSNLSWIAIAIIGVIIVWGSTGLLGFQPSIIASGSMRPALDVGDIAITVQTRTENIKVGDIIQYLRQGESAPIIHRVIQVDRAGGVTYIVTKGDANDVPDDPITVTQTLGKVVLIIPKLGWVSIALKTAISTAASFLQNNFAVTYALIGLTFAYSAFRIHKYRNQPLNKLKRRLRR